MVNFFQSNEDGSMDKDAIEYVLKEIEPILAYFETENEHIMRGMSLFTLRARPFCLRLTQLQMVLRRKRLSLRS